MTRYSCTDCVLSRINITVGDTVELSDLNNVPICSETRCDTLSELDPALRGCLEPSLEKSNRASLHLVVQTV